MIDLTCPKCGREGAIPRNKINTRLVCKKCHAVFHINSAGRTLLGEPQAEVAPRPEAKRQTEGLTLPSFEGLSDLKGSVPTFSRNSIIGILVGLLVVAGLYAYLNMPTENLERASQQLATRFADDDLAYLKQTATSETVDDVVRWFDSVHPTLVKNRDEWKTRATDVRVMVIDEDRRQRVGQSQAFIYPAKGGTHVAKVADAASETSQVGPAMIEPVDLKLHWILDRTGHWRLDGLQTYQDSIRTQ